MNCWNYAKFSLLGCFTAFSLISCSGSGSGSGSGGGNSVRVAKTSGFNPNHGPFDSRGNYREEWANNPPKRVYVSKDKLASTEIPTPEPYIPPIASYTPPVSQPSPQYTSPYKKPTPTYKKPTPVYKKPTPTYKKPVVKTPPKPVVTKVVPKKKPPILHVVAKGDTLYSLSQKYKSGVKTIQIANQLKGTTIQLGQTLKIPRF